MPATSRRQRASPDIWPGFVDALSALLIIVIFLLMVFTIAQYFLNNILSGRDAALEQLNRQVSRLTEMLQTEQAASADLRDELSRVSFLLGNTTAERDRLSSQLAELMPERDMLQAMLSDKTREVATLADLRIERDALALALEEAGKESTALAGDLEEARKTVAADRETIELQLRQIASLKRDVEALRAVRDSLEERVAAQVAGLEERERELGTLRDRSKELVAQLASEQERTLLSQKTIEEKDVRLAVLLGRAGEAETALAQEQKLSERAREQVRLLNAQIAALRGQLAHIAALLDASEARVKRQNVQIVNLSSRLNAALARKVQELASFRSEFFGRLRQALGDRRDVTIVGDRFVFQSEVLFPSGTATLQESGRAQIGQLARTLIALSRRIPEDINWVLRVDGHTDRWPISTQSFPSNWELSTARAVSVVKILIELGVPPNRLAATGFGQFQPLDRGNTVEAYRRNRRIEFKLTQR